MQQAFNKFKISARGYTRILKVSRTIADMDASTDIQPKHVLEAIQYRNLNIKA